MNPKNNNGLGAHFTTGLGTRFEVWAPRATSVEVKLYGTKAKPFSVKRSIVLTAEAGDRYTTVVSDVGAGDRYTYVLNGKGEFPDPASRFQPQGVHGPSQIVRSDFEWSDFSWKGMDPREIVFYECHIGTFTAEGTFVSAESRLSHLKELGVTAIEVMPVAQFPGARNWGYDGVYPFAVQNSYGGPEGFKHFINACHEAGIAVYLDVVYNHLGPEGNYLAQFGDYFTQRYKTPWGSAINFDGPGSDEVRRFFLSNARQWLEEFRIDGLRLDAVHAICDFSAFPFLEELGSMKSKLELELGRSFQLVAETDLNDSRLIRHQGIDAQWADDFHHALHTLLTGEARGYYQDFGSLDCLKKVYSQGVVFDGSWSGFRNSTHGRPYDGLERRRLVVCSQNHDQIGNRFLGDRLAASLSVEKLKLAAACVMLSPFTPLLFMGEEWGEKAPFSYFIDHSDPDLLEAVRKGRAQEFSSFGWTGSALDPASEEVFSRCKIDWKTLAGSNSETTSRALFEFYKKLIFLSKWIRRGGLLEEGHVQVKVGQSGRSLELVSDVAPSYLRCFFSFNDAPEEITYSGPNLEILLDSGGAKSENQFQLRPWSVLVLGSGGPDFGGDKK